MRDYIKWDSDYTKLTEQERIQMEQAEESGFIDEEDINWDNLEQYL